MNPFEYVRTQFYGESDGFGMSAAACLLLRVLEAGYTSGMAAGANPYQYVLSVLEQLAPDNDFLKSLTRDWNSRATH